MNDQALYSWPRMVLMVMLAAILSLGAPFAFAQDDQAAELAQEDELSSEEDNYDDEELIEEVTVTGSRIARNVNEIVGQLQVFDEDFITNSGDDTIERFLRRLPQNSNGTTVNGVSMLNGAVNYSGASTANLRGLGSNATLILVNGRRIGNDSFLGGVTDISTIPLSRVERIEVLMDGASSIYGADAVGGVINIITKKGYSGVTVGGDYSRPDAGGFDEYGVYINGGWDWGSGNLAATYDYRKNSGMVASKRQLALISEWDVFGGVVLGQDIMANYPWSPIYYEGPQGRLTVADWKALKALDPDAAATYAGINTATYGDDYLANPSFENIETGYLSGGAEGDGSYYQGELLLPEQQTHNASLAITQEVGGNTTLYADIMYMQRDNKSGGSYPEISPYMHAGNPANLLGVTHLVKRRLNGSEFNPVYFNSDTDRLSYNIGGDGKIGSNWEWHGNFSSNKSTTKTVRDESLDTNAINAAVNSDGYARIWVYSGSGTDTTGCILQVDYGWAALWACPGGIAPQSPFDDAWLSTQILPAQHAESENINTIFSAYVSGTLFELPAGSMRMVLGGEMQEQELTSQADFQIDTSGAVGSGAYSANVSRKVRSAFIETIAPLVNDVTAIQNLTLTLQARYDEYYDTKANRSYEEGGEPESVSDAGGDTTWGAGLVWSVNDQFRIKMNHQTAFVAPQLYQLFTLPGSAGLGIGATIILADGSTVRRGLQNITGGNPDLKPETSTTDSLGFEWTPSFLDGLQFSVFWHGTDYKNRITNVSPTSRIGAGIPEADPPPWVIVDPITGMITGIDNRHINSAYLQNDGIDYRVSYYTETGIGDFNFDLNIAQVLEYRQKGLPTDPEWVEAVGSSIDPRLSPVSEFATTAQLTWSRGGWSTTASYSSRDPIEVDFSLTSSTILRAEYPDIFNLDFAYDFDRGGRFNSSGWASGLIVRFTVENILDDFATSSRINTGSGERFDYKANAYTAIGRGRMFNLSISKEF